MYALSSFHSGMGASLPYGTDRREEITVTVITFWQLWAMDRHATLAMTVKQRVVKVRHTALTMMFVVEISSLQGSQWLM